MDIGNDVVSIDRSLQRSVVAEFVPLLVESVSLFIEVIEPVGSLVFPRPVMIAGVHHVAIVFVILGPIGGGVAAIPAVILMAPVVIAVAIAETDITEVDCDPCARGSGQRNGG